MCGILFGYVTVLRWLYEVLASGSVKIYDNFFFIEFRRKRKDVSKWEKKNQKVYVKKIAKNHHFIFHGNFVAESRH